MKKVLFFIESLSGGGAERALTLLVENLDKTKYDITVVSERDGELYTQRIKDVCRYRCFAKKPKHEHSLKKYINMLVFKFSCVAPPRIVKTLFVGNRYDIEVAFVEGYATKLVASSANKKSRKIAWLHSDVVNFPWTQSNYRDISDEAAHYKVYDKICCVSETVKESADEKFKVSDLTEVVYNPVDTKGIALMAQDDSDVEPKEKTRIITAGRLTQIKRFDRLINIAAKLKAQGFSFETVIMGAGEEMSSLLDLIQTQDVSDCVKLVGFKENPYKYIKHSDFFVCSSQAEGMSTIATECLVLGKPIITTDCSGMKELFGEHECGIICENSEDALFEAVKRVLEDPSLIEKFSANSEKRAEFFNMEQTIRAVEKILDGE